MCIRDSRQRLGGSTRTRAAQLFQRNLGATRVPVGTYWADPALTPHRSRVTTRNHRKAAMSGG
eukprot:134526-Lingulodinium_polyedra.AAC.1